jgi:serine/threonine-protein kinase HipA
MARITRTGSETVDVLLHAPELNTLIKIGQLFHRRAPGQSALSFAYSKEWLNSKHSFAVDPRLDLYAGEQFASGESNTFGIFLDSAPDRWGRVLLDRREALLARTEGRINRTLGEWDYLLGVQDECRTGALRFRASDAAPFLDNQPLPIPPVALLAELEAISLALEENDAEEMPAYRQWLSMLVAPGTSLGGSRPKANFLENDGSLWIVKFPSREDRRDIGAWEKLVHDLAVESGITTAPHSIKHFGSRYHSFCAKRFDRTTSGRRLFVSSMTLLDRRDGEGGSYLDLAEFIQTQGARGAIEADLEQLFRRVLFNVLVGNTDDHLRNHGFIREPTGWRLAPAYDLNPNPARRFHAIALNESSTVPDPDAVLETAELYRLTQKRAGHLLDEIRQQVSTWKKRAKSMQLSSEISAVEPSFALSA